MNCKDCIHYEACADCYDSNTLDFIHGSCINFDEKSEYMRLPCKVGDICWFIRNNKIIKTTVEKIVLKEKGLYLKLSCNSVYETTCRSIGKTVFFTYEEAEKVLKEDCNENN